MMQRTTVCIALAAAFTAMSAMPAWADGKGGGNANGRTFSTNLIGYNETPLTINSTGSGTFAATLDKDGTAISSMAPPVLPR